MDVIKAILDPIPIPRVFKVEQYIPHLRDPDPIRTLSRQLDASIAFSSVRSGQRIAIAAGSRKIDSLLEILTYLVYRLRAQGALPFIIPAMGSHGGATAQGQIDTLAMLGITEERIKAPIVSSMEVDQIGTTCDGRPVYFDRNANRADGIIINRIKRHPSFRGEYESGLMKMIVVGLGKEKGAAHYHQTGYELMSSTIKQVGQMILQQKNIICGIGIIEDAWGDLSEIVCLEKERIASDEPALLNRANALLPKIPFRTLDVLSIQRIGKDISGTGMDINVVGRSYQRPVPGMEMDVKRIVLHDLTDASCGNASGIGNADFITRRLYDKIRFDQTYLNVLTSTVAEAGKTPMTLDTDKLALAAAIKTSNQLDYSKIRLCLIQDTKHLSSFYASACSMEAVCSSDIRIVEEENEIPFDIRGNILTKIMYGQ